MIRPLKILTGTLLTLSMIGCVHEPPKKDWAYGPIEPPAMPPKPESNGAIYQAGYDQRWFEDIRARRVGDILTVQLMEETDASITHDTEIDKTTDVSITNGTILGQSPEFNFPFKPPGLSGSDLTLATDLDSAHSFDGEADTEHSNELTGSITVMVTEVLPNGYLKVRGEKRIGMNSGNEYVKLSGIVRPADIDTNNTVPSTRIADATVIYIGDGPIAEANVMGWLAKFFISSWMPF